ncbi:MAG: type II toxin-antitoxin system RelE/ParE family toxin [Betaproteobacteria bacterium]|nr:type II toxin-antitoxin system RelE/ParE family toxin [Betaproteobacteria bacterium]
MARVELAPEVAEDFERILDHLIRHEASAIPGRIHGLIQALDILQEHPLIGRPARNDKRELVIGRGARGYVALYRYLPEVDTVFVLAIKGQREAGYGSGVQE